MTWTIEFLPKIKKELKKLDKSDAKSILDYLEQRVLPLEDPKTIAIQLKSNLKEYWKFRVGNYRIIADIQDNKLTILVIRIANRKHVYSRFEKTKSPPKKTLTIAEFKKSRNPKKIRVPDFPDSDEN